MSIAALVIRRSPFQRIGGRGALPGLREVSSPRRQHRLREARARGERLNSNPNQIRACTCIARNHCRLRLLKSVSKPSQVSQNDRIDGAELSGELVDDVPLLAARRTHVYAIEPARIIRHDGAAAVEPVRIDSRHQCRRNRHQ
jgi:hypothetical protein